jgi:DNA topoisomerase-1
MSIVVIVESPSKCKRIGDILGKHKYHVIASYGHITELNNLSDIDVTNNFNTTYRKIKSKGPHILKLKQAIQRSAGVIIATDGDREGEAIGYHICNVFKLPIDTPRIIFNEITPTAILRAVLNPTILNLNLVHAAISRQIIDMLIGYNISPLLCNTFNKKLSAGRCQTPALNLLYDNHQQINIKDNTFMYKTSGDFGDNHIKVVLNHMFPMTDDHVQFLEKSKMFKHIFNKSEVTSKSIKPPAPYTTSSLQQSASNVYNYDPTTTMKLAQSLYENGYITYMRTDNNRYSEDFIKLINVYVQSKYGIEYINKNTELIINNNKDSNVHEAIRPTDISISPKNIDDPKERKLYHLILVNAIRSCMCSSTYNNIDVTITAPNNLIYKGSVIKTTYLGWKVVEYVKCPKSILYNYVKPPNESMLYNYISHIITGSVIRYQTISMTLLEQSSINHLTEARLVSILENKGIGRPSTFATIIDTLKKRKYVKKMNIEGVKKTFTEYTLRKDITSTVIEKTFNTEQNKLVILPLGIKVIEYLKMYDSLFNYNYTKHMESSLDDITKGVSTLEIVCTECNTLINTILKQANIDHRNTLMLDDNTIHNVVTGYIKPAISGINIEKVHNISVTDLIAPPIILGVYEGHNLILKHGKYGEYVEWGLNKLNIQHIPDKTLTNVVLYIIHNKNKRFLTTNSSIRNGKYGDYIYYKSKKMKKPKFISLEHYDKDHNMCSINDIIHWVNKTHNIIL